MDVKDPTIITEFFISIFSEKKIDIKGCCKHSYFALISVS